MPHRRTVSQCPLCDAPLRVTELSCTRCETHLRGVFPPTSLARLSQEQQAFIETFVLSRGVIREVERALGISYPTVRARLDSAVIALETARAQTQANIAPPPLPPPPPGPAPTSERRTDAQQKQRQRQQLAILRQVEEGFLEPEEAADALVHLL